MKLFRTKWFKVVALMLAMSLLSGFSIKTTYEWRLVGEDHSMRNFESIFYFSDGTKIYLQVGEEMIIQASGPDEICEVAKRAEFGWNEFNKTPNPVHEVNFFDYTALQSRPVIMIFIGMAYMQNKFQNKEVCHEHEFRIMAVAAPYWPKKAHHGKKYDLDSRIPFSLQNAMRCLAQACLDGKLNSNWSSRESLNDSIMLMNYCEEDLPGFISKLQKIKPQILFIGSMTLGIPGAIEIAKITKKLFGDKIFIILGGKHVNETFYLKDSEVYHHPCSPLLLMSEDKIPPVFDLVVSGDGEEIVLAIALRTLEILSPGDFFNDLSSFQDTRGSWLMGWMKRSKIRTIQNSGISLDRGSLPIPAKVFGVNPKNNFPIFGSGPTAHVYSDMGKGCMLDCFFCSERKSVNGSLQSISSGAQRFYDQLKSSADEGASSAFCDDSILLGGNVVQLNLLANLLEQNPLDIKFGVQFTVPLLLNEKVQASVKRLSQLGLTYIFVGLETGSEEIAQKIDKCGNGRQSWISKNESAIEFLTNINVDFGAAVLFGIGESQDDRASLLKLLILWQKQYQGNPKVVSLNWAVQHPLLNQGNFDYLEWGTAADDPRLALYQELFGEASVNYCMADVDPPSLQELIEIRDNFLKLNLKN